MNETETSLLDMRTSALLRITSAIETATTLDELLLLALSQSAHLIDVPRSGIVLLSDGNDTAQLVSMYPPRVSLPPPIPLVETPYLNQVITTRRSIHMYDVATESPHNEMLRLFQEDSIHTLLIVPLVAQDRVIGVLVMATVDEPRDFSEADVALVRVLTGPLATAIYALQITESARRRNAELATLHDIATAITSSLDTREIYHLVVRQLNEYFRVDAGSLLLRDDITGDLEFVMTLEGGEEKLAGVRIPRGHGVAGHVAENQRYEVILDAQHDPRFYSKISEDMGYITKSILCVPMLVKNRTIGVIELLNKQDGDFTDADAERLSRMASTIGVAIENARLFQQVATGRDRLEAILNSTNDGILMADMRGCTVTANHAAATLFRTTVEEIERQQVSTLMDELRSRAKEVSSPSWLHDDDEETNISNVIELEIIGTRHQFIRHFSLPVYDANKIEIGQLLLFQDISKERELSQLRDDFTGMLVHDLRAPLTAIMNGIMMVQRGLAGSVSDQQQELLKISYQSSQTMLEMVNTLLDISKMEQGRMALNFEPLSPYDVVDETVDRLRASAAGHRIRIEQQLGIGLPLIEADRDKLVRVLQNLLDNAIKFSPKNSEVTLGAAYVHLDQHTNGNVVLAANSDDLPITLPKLSEDDWLVFWVRDRGIGIPQQYHDRVFEKFGQVRGRKARGTGLGLTFCKLTVESHNGHIWLESAEGQGSTFALVLPLAQEQVEE